MYRIVEDEEYCYVYVANFMIQIKKEEEGVVVDIWDKQGYQHLSTTSASEDDIID